MKASISFLTTLAITTLCVSCNPDDDNAATSVVAPTTYKFERNNATTVDFSGQTIRIAMATETFNALLDPTQNLTAINNKFAHVQGSSNFSNALLNSSDKDLRSKVAASADYFASNTTVSAAIRADFDNYIAGQVNDVFPAWNTVATAGNPGNLQQAGGGTTRYLNGKGLSYSQAFAKGLIGGLLLDQVVNNYLSPAVLDAGNKRTENDNGTLATGKNYTTMEHNWDEAFGYIYGAEVDIENPTLSADSFLGQYLGRTENDPDFAGIAQTMYDAFKLGRAAIVAKNYSVRDQQAKIIQDQLSKIIGIRAVYYLQVPQEFLTTDKARAFHGLSEGYGFIYSLQFTKNTSTNAPYFTRAEVQTILNTLMTGNGFWDLTPATLNTLSTTIAARFDFTVAQAIN